MLVTRPKKTEKTPRKAPHPPKKFKKMPVENQRVIKKTKKKRKKILSVSEKVVLLQSQTRGWYEVLRWVEVIESDRNRR